MREPSFWWRGDAGPARLLASLAAVYGRVAASRMARRGRDAGMPVLCVGNLTLGGAGKTPTAIHIAELLIRAGRNPFLLSRGYGGRLKGPIRVDPARHHARDVGEEALLLARAAPTIVGADRVAGAAQALAEGADVAVMDDGFQNPALDKTWSVVVVDGRRGIGNGRVFPAGPLRAPLGAQLDRAQALLVVGEGSAAAACVEQARARRLPVHRGRLEPEAGAVAALRGLKVLAFAGIGDPEKFFATLAGAGIAIGARLAFPDHHRYSAAEAAELLARADREGLVPVTTEKDMARLVGEAELAALAERARTLPVRLVVEDEAAFRDLVLGVADPSYGLRRTRSGKRRRITASGDE